MVQIRPSISILLRPFAINNMIHTLVAGGKPSTAIRNSVQSVTGVLQQENVAFTTAVKSNRNTSTHKQKNEECLLLEGDTFAVSHDGIARTGYHLNIPFRHEQTSSETPSLHMTIEENYDLQRAHKKYVIRHRTVGRSHAQEGSVDEVLGKQAVGIAPLGAPLGTLNIQEIDQGVFGSAGTGATTWEASIAMGLFFSSYPRILRGHVLELGCGVGFGSILTHMGAALRSEGSTRDGQVMTKSMTLTDGNNDVLDQCRKNLQSALVSLGSVANISSLPSFYVKKLQWELASLEAKKYDTIIACDVAYLHTQVNSLINAMATLLEDNGRIHLFGPYNRGALQQVCRVLQEEKGFDLELEFIELDRYRLKPYSRQNRKTTEYNSSNMAYQSKSTATFLHATARRPDPTKIEEKQQRSLNEID